MLYLFRSGVRKRYSGYCESIWAKYFGILRSKGNRRPFDGRSRSHVFQHTAKAFEYEFADRMLSATIGAGFLAIQLGNHLGDKKINWTDIYTLADHFKYPMSHWLLNVKASYGVSSLAELAINMQLMEYSECHVPHKRLKKWSSGADLMPVSVANALCKASGQNYWHWVSFFLARTLTFIVDFLVAAAPVEPKRQVIQKIVDDRFVNLGHNLCIAWAKRSQEPEKETVPFEAGANAQDASE